MIKIKESRREAEILSQQLRNSSSLFMQLRRGILGLSMVSALAMQLISLYQMGIIKHLPDPPLPHIDSDKVDASPSAYEKLETPDAILALANYAVTMTLTGMGAPDRAKTQPWIPIAMAAKIGFDTYEAAQLYINHVKVQKVFCFWCITAASTTALAVPLAIPETYAAVRNLFKKFF